MSKPSKLYTCIIYSIVQKVLEYFSIIELYLNRKLKFSFIQYNLVYLENAENEIATLGLRLVKIELHDWDLQQ